MLALGTLAPAFDLPDAYGERHTLAEFTDADGLVIAFICNHCPFVKHVEQELAAFGRDCAAKNVAVIAINSNDIESHPDDAPERMRETAERLGYVFPYLFDETQAVAKAYRAACTPDFFLFDGNRRLVYRGQFDGSRPGNAVPVTGRDLRRAVDALLSGQAPDSEQIPSIGCNIKWKSGNTPEYFG
jgi:peroxiredoxin